MNGAGGFTMPQQPQAYSPSSGQISPGSITYTTSTGPDGSVTYHPFKAVPASYQTAQGVVHGIQWVPAEATQILPAGAQPATAEFAASWNRGQLSRDEQKALEKWQRSEEKRRKKEEKHSLKRSISQQFDNAAGYPPGTAAYGAYSTADLDHKFGNLEVERREPAYGARSRKNSHSSANRTSIYAQAAGAGVYQSTTTYNATGYPTAGGGSPYNRATSPFRPAGNFSTAPNNYPPTGGGSPYTRATSPFRPTGNYSTAPNNYPATGGASPYNRAASPFRPPGNFSTSPNIRPQEFQTSTYPGGPEPIARAASPYAPQPYGARAPSPMPQPQPPPPRAPSPYARPPSRAPSPYHGQQSTTPYPPRAPSPFVPPPQIHSTVYPRGHVLEGQPINAPRSRAPSPMPGGPGGQGYGRAPSPMPGGPGFGRAPSPMPGAYTGSGFPSSPRMPGTAVGGDLQLAAPEAFSRPPNAAQPYTPFNVMRVQDMDDFYDQIPRMPLVLDTHDVYHQDWIRFMNDIALAWAGKMPIPEFSRGGVPPKRSTLVADLINLWNDSFFRSRRVEVVLYKGRERRSGPHAGTVDSLLPMPLFDSDSDLSDSDSSSSESDDGYYGRGMDLAESKRRRREVKEEKKRRKKEKKLRKKAKERQKQYALYLNYVPPREMPGPGGHNFYG
ncbi:hypothetical protein K503DRAFT_865628 [Rhizopogon vinicolor AM-OR11-026]|uniref:Uncharacterized protein n=1 Tax=Rhizopogon vinicolor AM-OR11-026 TaxID=1314800 RepID=A0A1B7N2S9_9AGAM|nr:hypothetical protein K503DRAFT_865628 [Rhizopogon vinicolor AM-OR11-026]